MSVLLVRANGRLGELLVERLLAQGDEVRVIEPNAAIVPEWRALGALVARGDDTDADLIERAAQNVRTAVVLDGAAGAEHEFIEALIEGLRAAQVERIVMVAHRLDDEVSDSVAASGLDHVLMHLPKPKGLLVRKEKVSPERLAEAIDAADDLAGNPKMRLDLADPSSWTALGLDAPV
jgi:hypothetical protein